MDNKTKKLILIIVIPVIIIFVFVFMFSFFSTNGNKNVNKSQENRMSDIIPDSKYAGDTIDDRLQFLEYQENQENIELMKENDYSDRGLAELLKKTREGESKDTQIVSGRDRYISKDKEPRTIERKKTKPTPKRQTSAVVKTEPKAEPAAPPKPKKRHSALSIQRGSGNMYGENSQPINEKYYRAVTESDLTVREQGQMLFILQEDLYYPPLNKTFPRYSTLYGYSSMTQHYADVIINRIKSTDNKTYNVNLVGYNSNYQRGIRYDGRYDRAMKRTGQRTSGVVGSMIGNKEITQTQTENIAGDATQNVGQEVFKDVSFGIHKGLIMNFIIEEKNE